MSKHLDWHARAMAESFEDGDSPSRRKFAPRWSAEVLYRVNCHVLVSGRYDIVRDAAIFISEGGREKDADRFAGIVASKMSDDDLILWYANSYVRRDYLGENSDGLFPLDFIRKGAKVEARDIYVFLLKELIRRVEG